MATNPGNTNLVTTAPNLADAAMTDYYYELEGNTNYVDTVIQNSEETYVSESEVRAALNYRDAFRQGDIVTALNGVYNTLINFSFLDDTFSFDTILYWYLKLKYGNKEIVDLNNTGSTFGNKILPNLKPSVSGNLFSSFSNGLSNQLGSAIGSLGGLLANVKNLNGDYGNGLSSIAGQLSDTGTVQQTFFDSVSDSIGTLTNSKYLQLDSTLPIFDVSQEYYGVPIPYSCSTDSKISNNTRNVAYSLSIHSTALMRRNLLNVAYSIPAVQENMAADSTVAHGLNLINDLPTFVTLNGAVASFTETLASNYDQPRVFQFVRFLSNIGNKFSYNLRDIFPATAQDKDFLVVTSADRALASASERKALSDQAIIDSYLEQQGINYANAYNGGSYASSAGNFGAPGNISIFNSNNTDQNKNINNFLNGISYLETDNSARTAAGTEAGNTGYFRMNQDDANRAMAAGLPDPRVGTYDQQAAATWAYIQKFKPGAAAAIVSGDYTTATRLLNNFWVSLPGSGQQQQAASRYTEWNNVLQGKSTYNIPLING